MPGKVLEDHGIFAVLAGNVSVGGEPAKERVAVFGGPGDHFPDVTATEPSLIWLVR